MIKQFRLGERLPEVQEAIHQLICPALHILDSRQTKEKKRDPGAAEQQSQFTSLMEDIRGQWCGMLGDEQIPKESESLVSDLLTVILETPAPTKEQEGKMLTRNRDHIDQQMDLSMAMNYREALRKGTEKCNGEGSKF